MRAAHRLSGRTTGTRSPRPVVAVTRGIGVLIVALLVLGVFCSAAAANTPVTENITTDTTWTQAGSPYDLDKESLFVMEGATLTIEPGVTVDFNSDDSGYLSVKGAVKARGTASDPVTFTSHQGLEGAGGPGQYLGLRITSGNAASTFSYADFYYGGYGTGPSSYLAVLQVLEGSTVKVDHSVFEHNGHSGLRVYRGSATVSRSTSAHNEDGLTASGYSVLTADHDLIVNNSHTGVSIGLVNKALPGSFLTYDTIADNASFGVTISQYCTSPLSSFAHGEYNNIYANGEDGEAGQPYRQLSTAAEQCEAIPVDWRNNYWGSDVYYYRNTPECASTETPFPGRLAYAWSNPSREWEAPSGPVWGRTQLYYTGHYFQCAWDTVKIGPNEFLTSPVAGAPEPTPNMVFGEPGLFAPYLPTVKCRDPVNCITGDFDEARTDLRVPGLNGGLSFRRTYNSLAALEGAESPLGHGWSFEYGEKLELDPSGTAATITNADGSRVSFTEEEGAWTAPAWVQATLVHNEDGSFTYTLPSLRAFHFSSEGKLLSIADRNGNETTLSYTEGRLTTVTEPAGRQLTFAYNASGQIESVTDPAGHKASFAYDEAGNLMAVTAPDETSESYGYDASHLMTSMKDPRGGETTNAYDEEGRVTSQVDPMERKTTWTYGEEETEVTLPNGAVTKIQFADNLPTEITHAYGTEEAATTKYEYDADLYPIARTDADGHKTEYGYDAEGNRTSETDALGHETTWTYNSKHQVVSMTTPRGEKTTIERDADGNPTSISRPAPGEATQTTTVEYDSRGLPESVTDPLERTWHLEHDGRGDLSAVTDPLGHERTMGYDEDSRLISVVSPRGNLEGANAAEYKTTIERDARGRPLKVTDPLGHTTEYAWDGNDNLVSRTDAKGHTTKYAYDADDELTAIEKPSGAVLKTAYDSLGQVVAQTDPNEHTTEYVRNLLGRPVEVVDPLARKTSAEYDAAGNLTSFTDPEGRTTSYSYDAANRLTKASYSEEATPDVEVEYDADGNPTRVTDGTGTESYAYDLLDRLTEAEDGHGDTVGYEFDLGEELRKITYPNGKALSRAFDEAGRLASVTDWLENTTSFAYDADSNLTATTFPEGTGEVDEYTHDRADQMSGVTMAKGTETLASLSYARDELGQLESLTSAGLPGAAEEAFAYDADNRLTKAGEASFEYDLAGNLTKAPGTENSYDVASQLEAATGLTYAYDKLGERTKATPQDGPATSYGYDQAGELTSVQRAPEGEAPAIDVSYAYDGAGLLASRTSGETTSYLTWDENAPLPLLLSDGPNSYIYGPGGLPVEQISSLGAPTYYHHDQLGSTRLLTNASGEAVGRFTYGPYGKLEASTGSETTPLGFAGQYTDPETGLQYLRARFYDPATGQFMSRDPIEALTRQPYSYAEDNPLNLVDPSGRDVLPVPAEACAAGPEAAAGCAGIGAGVLCASNSTCRGGVQAVAEGAADVASSIVGIFGGDDEADEAEQSESSGSETVNCDESPGEGPEIDERNAGHIFRDETGHLAEDTPENRELLEGAAKPENYVETKPPGVDVYRETLPNGKQIWVDVYDGKITNGGINQTPR